MGALGTGTKRDFVTPQHREFPLLTYVCYYFAAGAGLYIFEMVGLAVTHPRFHTDIPVSSPLPRINDAYRIHLRRISHCQ